MKKFLLITMTALLLSCVYACGSAEPEFEGVPYVPVEETAVTPEPTPAPAERYKDAEKSIDDGDYEHGIPALEALANEEYGPAMGLLGLCYETGAGVTADAKTALDWYEKAAAQKDAGGYAGLGHLYYYGTRDVSGNPVIEENAELAVKNLLLAVALDEQRSYGDLAAAYLEGKGVAYRPDVAFRLCQVASKDGSPAHLTDLGELYYFGDSFGIEKNVAAARQCFTDAAESDYAEAQYYLGVLSYYEDADYEDAYNWYDLAAKQGNADAENALGAMNYDGVYVKRNYFEAFRLFKLAADQGNSRALYNLGILYEKGQGTKRDLLLAAAAYGNSAAQQYTPAMCALGMLYFNGRGVQRDRNRAAQIWQEAALLGSQTAQGYLTKYKLS